MLGVYAMMYTELVWAPRCVRTSGQAMAPYSKRPGSPPGLCYDCCLRIYRNRQRMPGVSLQDDLPRCRGVSYTS